MAVCVLVAVAVTPLQARQGRATREPAPITLAALVAAPTSAYIAFVDHTNALSVYDVAESGITTLESEARAGGDAFRDVLSWPAGNLAWSPDGQTLAFIGDQEETGADLYVYTPKTGAVENLTAALPLVNDLIGFPAWSPNGEWLAFVAATEKAFDATLGFDIPVLDTYVVARDGRQIVRSSAPVRACRLAWSPDGAYIASNTACFSGPGEDVSLLVLAFNARASALSLHALLPAGEDVSRYQYAHGVPAWQSPTKLAVVRRLAPRRANIDASDVVTQVVAVDVTAQQDEEVIFTLGGESAAPGDERSGNWVLWTGLAGDQRRRLIGYNLVTGWALDLPNISERCLGLRATVSPSDAYVALQCGYHPGETPGVDVFDVATGQVVDAIGAEDGGQLVVPLDWLCVSSDGEQLLVWESAPPEGRPSLRALDVRTGAATFRIVLNGG